MTPDESRRIKALANGEPVGGACWRCNSNIVGCIECGGTGRVRTEPETDEERAVAKLCEEYAAVLLDVGALRATNMNAKSDLAIEEMAHYQTRASLEKVLAFLEREGFRRCDLAACNCGSWHGPASRLRDDLEAERAAHRLTQEQLVFTRAAESERTSLALEQVEEIERLEAERDDALRKLGGAERLLALIGDKAVTDWDDETVGQVDAVITPPKTYGAWAQSLLAASRKLAEAEQRIATLEQELAEAKAGRDTYAELILGMSDSEATAAEEAIDRAKKLRRDFDATRLENTRLREALQCLEHAVECEGLPDGPSLGDAITSAQAALATTSPAPLDAVRGLYEAAKEVQGFAQSWAPLSPGDIRAMTAALTTFEAAFPSLKEATR